MPRDFPYLYPYSLADARSLGETQQYDDSFHLNVDCARAIEQAIRDHFDDESETITEGCAQSVLERFGFKRTNFVLANSLKEMGCPHLISDEVRQWGQKTCQAPHSLQVVSGHGLQKRGRPNGTELNCPA